MRTTGALLHALIPGRRDAAALLLAFVIIVAGGKLGQWLYFAHAISPAVIWPPVGIAMAAVYLGGFRFTIAVAAAHTVLIISQPQPIVLNVVYGLTVVLSYTAQAALGGWLLRRLSFNWLMQRVHDVFVLLGVAVLIPILSPTLIVLARLYADMATPSPLSYWATIWAGGVFSVLTLTPLMIVAWRSLRRDGLQAVRLPRDMSLAFAVLAILGYLLFWMSWSRSGTFVLMYAYLSALFFIGLRFGARAIVSALSLTAAAAVSGAFVLHRTDGLLPAQLFTAELVILLLAPVFFIVAALVEERRIALEALRARTKRLEQSLAELARADELKNEFIAILAHELRNPLAPVLSTVELLELRAPDADFAHHLARVKEQAYMMRHLLDDLLDVARITQHKFVLKKKITHVSVLLANARAAVEIFVASAGHSLHVEDNTGDVRILADPVRLEQVLINLLNNAAKYTSRGGHITLAAALDGDALVLRVRDDGIGLTKEQTTSIFKPFRQAQDSPRVGTGLGIGLWLARMLVEEHGGTLTAASEGRGKGSTFTVRLPGVVQSIHAASHAGHPESQEQLNEELRREDRMSVRAKRVLVVDDNVPAARSLATLLEFRGFTVEMCHNGTSAQRAVELFEPDAVLLDIGLPDVSGFEVVAALKRRWPRLPVVALSGYGQNADVEKGRRAGFSEHLVKPVASADVERALTRVLARD